MPIFLSRQPTDFTFGSNLGHDVRFREILETTTVHKIRRPFLWEGRGGCHFPVAIFSESLWRWDLLVGASTGVEATLAGTALPP
jgi:hypothetical protein